MLLVISKLCTYYNGLLIFKRTYNITVFPLLAHLADTLSFKMKIIYWIENKQILEV